MAFRFTFKPIDLTYYNKQSWIEKKWNIVLTYVCLCMYVTLKQYELGHLYNVIGNSWYMYAVYKNRYVLFMINTNTQVISQCIIII